MFDMGESGSDKASGPEMSDVLSEVGDSEPCAFVPKSSQPAFPRISTQHTTQHTTQYSSYGIRHKCPTQAAGMGGPRGSGLCPVF